MLPVLGTVARPPCRAGKSFCHGGAHNRPTMCYTTYTHVVGREQHPDQTHLTGIHLNLGDQAIEFEDQHGTIGRLRFTDGTVLYEGQPLLLTPKLNAGLPAEPTTPRTVEPARSATTTVSAPLTAQTTLGVLSHSPTIPETSVS